MGGGMYNAPLPPWNMGGENRPWTKGLTSVLRLFPKVFVKQFQLFILNYELGGIAGKISYRLLIDTHGIKPIKCLDAHGLIPKKCLLDLHGLCLKNAKRCA